VPRFGVDSVEDLTYVEKKQVEALTWLKPIKQAKLLRLAGLSGAEAAERRECVGCFAGGSDVGGWVLLQPCGYLCVCKECVEGLEQCPLCTAGKPLLLRFWYSFDGCMLTNAACAQSHEKRNCNQNLHTAIQFAYIRNCSNECTECLRFSYE
jgi:hypothetical protein